MFEKSLDSLAKQPVDLHPLIRCPECKNTLPPNIKITIDYFQGLNFQCHECKKTINWWTVILNTVQEWSPLEALAPIGARSTIFIIKLSQGTPKEFNLDDYGIPTDSKILAISYTPQGAPLFPAELCTYTTTRYVIPHEFKVFPISLGTETKETDVGVWVVWVPHTADDDAWQKLVQGFESYITKQYDSAIINANIAIESKIGRLLYAYLDIVLNLSKKHIEDFLVEGATYGHQLNILLPLITYMKEFPPMSDNIRGLLNRLRKLRNKLVHEGIIEKQLEKNEVAEMMTAALFGFRYLELLEPELTNE